MSKDNIDAKLKFYVLNYSHYDGKVVTYNIFNNIHVHDATIQLVNEYHKDRIKSFEEFVEELKRIVMWQEWSRREYEISVGDAFENDLDKFEKWDCYAQFEPNAEMFAHYLLDVGE